MNKIIEKIEAYKSKEITEVQGIQRLLEKYKFTR